MTEALRELVDDALARAVVYRTLAIGFQAPTDGRLRQVGARTGFRVVTAALRRLDRRGGRAQLAPAAERLARLPVPEDETLAATYWRLFGHTTRGLVCACQTEYGPDNGFHQPQQLADISGYYLAFGLRPTAGSEARADHIASECEFMDFLSRKEALWLSRGPRRPTDDDTLEVTRQAARTFLRDHLGRFGRAFATGVLVEDSDGYFGALGHLLLAFVEAECTRVGVEAGPEDLILRPEEVDETPMACGVPDELIQIQRRP